MQSETGFPSSHQLKSYVASKSRLKLAARAVLSADAGLLVECAKQRLKSLKYAMFKDLGYNRLMAIPLKSSQVSALLLHSLDLGIGKNITVYKTSWYIGAY